MGEIRSTLDIIMEKAKDVEVTDADKAAFMRREVEGKVKGVLQKYLDGVIKKERLKAEFKGLDKHRHEMAMKMMGEECLERLAPDGDNERLFEVLANVIGLNVKPVRDLVDKYQQAREEARNKREAVLLERFKDQGISGSAVVPNLAADSEWIGTLAQERDRFHQKAASLSHVATAEPLKG